MTIATFRTYFGKGTLLEDLISNLKWMCQKETRTDLNEFYVRRPIFCPGDEGLGSPIKSLSFPFFFNILAWTTRLIDCEIT